MLLTFQYLHFFIVNNILKGIWSLEGRVKDSEEDTTAVEVGSSL